MSALPLTPDSVAEIVAILDGSGYDRLDIKTEAFRLRIQRDESGEGWSQEWDLAEPDAARTSDATAKVEDVPEGLVAVSAPLPGMFYRAPQPGAPPFVEVGQTVEADTVVGIIETMKLMNPVHAGCAGVIAAIPAENGQMLNGGAVIMHVSPI